MTGENMAAPRLVPEGEVPLVSVEGTAYECGQAYAEICVEKWTGYRRYLDPAFVWNDDLSAEAKELFDARAPHIPEVYRGIADVAGPPAGGAPLDEHAGCTSFSLSGSVTLDGQPISGQTKDGSVYAALQYIVLRMRVKDAPTILVLCYPGEVMGYGMWSNGMSLFRNALYSTAGSEHGLTFAQWGLLALAGDSAADAAELAEKRGIRSSGNALVSDANGESLSVEFNVGGVSVIPARDGISTHANHPEGEKTSPFEDYPDPIERENSRYRMSGLWGLFNAERGRLTPQSALHVMADHSRYPRGVCRHITGQDLEQGTSACVVAEPTRGRLHVTRGHPCMNWPALYEV